MRFSEDCVFCNIIRKKLPSFYIFENDTTVGFLDINPLNPGHTLVCPREHYEVLVDMPEELLKATIVSVKEVARRVTRSLRYEGCNILQNNDSCAGQAVPHVHFHVIPRNPKDGVKFGWAENIKNMTPQELEQVYRAITSVKL